MQWRPAGAILGFLWVALSPPDDSSGSADEKAPQRTARPPISFPKGFLSRNRVKSAPKLRQPTLQEALPALNASKIREQQPRWCVLYEPLAARYNILPPVLSAKAIKNYTGSPRPQPAGVRGYVRRPLDFDVIADLFNEDRQEQYLARGSARLVDNIHLDPTPANDIHLNSTSHVAEPLDKSYQHLPGVTSTGLPSVLKLRNDSHHHGFRNPPLGRKKRPDRDFDEIVKQRNMMIQTRATLLLCDREPNKVFNLTLHIRRWDREELDAHLLGARIVFDMGLQDLRHERDDAKLDIDFNWGEDMNLLLRRRGQARAAKWWSMIREAVGNDTARDIIADDPHLLRMREAAEQALEIELPIQRQGLAGSEPKTGTNTEASALKGNWSATELDGLALAEQREALLDWVVSDRASVGEMAAAEYEGNNKDEQYVWQGSKDDVFPDDAD
ncbi:hypothetical protein AAMO2058_000236700 [Amorphochlora amoebiformis]